MAVTLSRVEQLQTWVWEPAACQGRCTIAVSSPWRHAELPLPVSWSFLCPAHLQSPEAAAEQTGCRAGCEYAAVERVNKEHVAPVLRELVQQPFFRYFKVWPTIPPGRRDLHAGALCSRAGLVPEMVWWTQVNLWCECPFWPDDGMCMLRDCSVCECEDEEVPAPWKHQEAGGDAPCDGALAPPACRSMHLLSPPWHPCRCLRHCCACHTKCLPCARQGVSAAPPVWHEETGKQVS